MSKLLSETEITTMFNEISKKYDGVNRALSMGIDLRWRKEMLKLAPEGKDLSLLDLATGTGDQLILFKKSSLFGECVGIDLAEEMLAIGREKTKHLDGVELKCASALDVPEKDGSFDCVTMSFGIRNVGDPLKCLQEMHRCLRDQGRALILEFSIPRNPIIRKFHLFYLRKILPNIGGMLSGKKKAYRYLNQTIESFPYGEEFTSLMLEAGFSKASALPLSFGIATIYVGEKS